MHCSSGETFDIDAATAGQSKLKAKTFVHVFAPDGTLLQTIEFHTSGSQPLVLGDQFGAARLVAYLGEEGTGETVDDSEVVATGSGDVFSFVPTRLGTYTVTFTVTDDDGGVGTSSMEVEVGMVLVAPDPEGTGQTVLFVGGSMGRDKIDLHRGDEPDVCSGLMRWRRGPRGWRPAAFTPVTPNDTSMEGNIHRDVDGSVLFGARCSSHEKGDAVSHGIRVWRSTDGGRRWEQVLSAAKVRASTPVVLNQAADGTPYVTANPYRDEVVDDTGRRCGVWSHRQHLWLWPLSQSRRSLRPPLVVRDADASFGPPPRGRMWFVDHPIANTVQLADGEWHNLLCYRVRESQPTRDDCERSTAFTGSFIEEVRSTGEPLPRWRF